MTAREDTATLREDAASVREDAVGRREETSTLREDRDGTVTAREGTATLREDAARVREVAAGRREETSMLREDTATLREDAASVREEAAQVDLRDSRDLLAQTGRMAKVGGWQLNVDTQTLIWTEEVYGIHEVDPATKPTVAEAIQFYAPESRPVITAAIQAAINAGTSFDLELPLMTARGRPIWVRTLGIAERLDGKTIRVYGALQDITARKQSEVELASLARFPSENPDPILRIARDGTLLYINPAGLGLLPQWHLEVGHASPPILREAAFNSLDNGSTHVLDLEHGERVYSFFVAPIIAGRYANFYGRDITARKQTEVHLRATAEMLDTAPSSITVSDGQGRFLFANRKTYEIHGYDEREFMALNLRDVLVSESAELIEKRMRIVAERGEATFEVVHVRKDRTTLTLDVFVKQVEWAGAPAVLSIATDITIQKRTEEALRASEHQHRTIVQTAMDGFWMADMQGRLLDVNEAYCRMSGYTAQELLALRIPDLDANESAADASAHFAKIVAQGGDRFEARHRRKDGTLFDVEVSAQYQPRDGGRFVGFLRDITARKRAEEALRESEYFFRESQRVAFIGSYKTDFTTDFWESSEVLDQIFGIGRDYSRSVQGWLEIVHPDDREMMDRYLRDEVIAKRTPFDKEYRIIRKADGEVRWVSEFGDTSFDADGNILSMIGTIQDITQRKRAEAERATLEAQLRQVQKMESVGRLAGGVAHDFNNMLGVILGHAELALAQVDPAQPLHDDLLAIRSAADHSADLTRQLLAFARKQTVAPKVLDLNETVGSILTMLRRLIGEDIDLLWRPGKHPWRIRVDPSQIDQILANLCVNARDAIAGVGKVTIETETTTFDDAYCALHPGSVPGQYVRLSVSDDGCGMDTDTLLHVFEPFFTTKALGKGTGLGLSTVYGIVKQNHGFINVYSEPEQGTTFTIYLPRHVIEAGQARTTRAPEPASRGHETILLVEDDPAVLNMTTRLLARQGYTVLAAGSPAEAIRVAGEHAAEIHLVMTDVVMPEMNGRDLATKLLALYPNLKRLFTSGYTANVIAHNGVLDEGVHFLQKPFSVHDLAAKVREVLDQS